MPFNKKWANLGINKKNHFCGSWLRLCELLPMERETPGHLGSRLGREKRETLHLIQG